MYPITPAARARPRHRIHLIAAAAAIGLLSFPADAHDLPLGDGKVSGSPKVGHVYSCQRKFDPDAPGARVDGPWIGTSDYDPSEKPAVEGSVSWNAKLELRKEGRKRIVLSNALPATRTGNFPVRRSDPAYRYARNPNSINAMNIVYEMPAEPRLAGSPGCVPMGMIGITVTNTAIFNALDARGQDAPAHEIQDACNGHPQQTGQYHFHNLSPCLNDTRSGPDGTSDILGYALDGFGIYGPYENGRKLTSADLDTCHGRTSPVMWDGEVVEMYHYVFTEDYPYTIGCFRGTPARLPASLQAGAGGPRGDPPPGGPHAGPRARLTDAAAELGVPVDQLMRAVGPPPPDFQRASRMLGIPAERIRQAMGGR